MQTNKERREVAARLRGLDEATDTLSQVYSRQEYDAMVLSAIRAVVGEGDIFHLLADLIDRPTCKNNSEFGSHTVTVPDAANDECFDFVCSRCGIHLMGDEMDNSPLLDDRFRSYALRYCPNCGAEVQE